MTVYVSLVDQVTGIFHSFGKLLNFRFQIYIETFVEIKTNRTTACVITHYMTVMMCWKKTYILGYAGT